MHVPRLLLVPLAALLLSIPVARAQAVGSVTALSGLLVARSTDGATRVLAVNSPVHVGDTLSTQRDTFAQIAFKDDAQLLLQPATTLVVTRYAYEPDQPAQDRMELSLARGGLRSTGGKLAQRSAQATVITTPVGVLQGSASMVVAVEPPRP